METSTSVELNTKYALQEQVLAYQELVAAFYANRPTDRDLFDKTVQMIWNYGYLSGSITALEMAKKLI